MSNWRRLARERLEIYLAHHLLVHQRLILGYAVATVFLNSMTGYAALLPALFRVPPGTSYRAALITARLRVWIGTLGRHDG